MTRRNRFKLALVKAWYQPKLVFWLWPLLPFALLFQGIVQARRFLYRHHFFKTTFFHVPVIVVGNVTIGGVGKTPFVIWLADYLKAAGYFPGIVSRGYGGSQRAAHFVSQAASPKQVGDEALLLARKTKVPVVIGKDRVQAVTHLLQKTNCNIVISDDGLQHLALGRTLEMILIDSKRLLGNGFYLPAGPLRETLPKSLPAQTMVVCTNSQKESFSIAYHLTTLVNLNTKATLPLTAFPKQTVHAVSGIGDPDRFFSMLRDAGFTVIPHAFPDHYLFSATDFTFETAHPIIMTEKDAMKCESLCNENMWYVELTLTASITVTDWLKRQIGESK